MRWISRTSLQRQFGLPAAIANELLSEHTRLALLRRWQPWAWLMALAVVVALVCRGACPALPPRTGLWVLMIGMWGWRLLGQWLAHDAIRAAAKAWEGRLGRAINREGHTV